jgi:cytochrome c553
MGSSRRPLGALISTVGLLAPALAGAAGDATAGRDKAQQCMVCHGLDGVATRPDVPNIGGESDLYLTKQLEAFRAGERRHEQMSIIAEGLSDQDIADLAAWYASLIFEVRMPD